MSGLRFHRCARIDLHQTARSPEASRRPSILAPHLPQGSHPRYRHGAVGVASCYSQEQRRISTQQHKMHICTAAAVLPLYRFGFLRPEVLLFFTFLDPFAPVVPDFFADLLPPFRVAALPLFTLFGRGCSGPISFGSLPGSESPFS